MERIDPLLLSALAESAEGEASLFLPELGESAPVRWEADSSVAFRLACSGSRADALAPLLCRMGFDPNAEGPDGLDSASWCARESHWPGACAILGLDRFEPRREHLKARSLHGMGLASAAAAMGQVASLAKLLEAIPEFAHHCDPKGVDAFWHACEAGNPRCALLLAPRTRTMASYPDMAGPLHMAAKLEVDHCCNILISRGARADIADELGRLPLHWAAASGSWRCAAILCDPLHLKARDFEGRTPLELARLYGSSDCQMVLMGAMEREELLDQIAEAQGEASSGRL